MDKCLAAAAQAQARPNKWGFVKIKDILRTRGIMDNMLIQLTYIWIHAQKSSLEIRDFHVGTICVHELVYYISRAS